MSVKMKVAKQEQNDIYNLKHRNPTPGKQWIIQHQSVVNCLHGTGGNMFKTENETGWWT